MTQIESNLKLLEEEIINSKRPVFGAGKVVNDNKLLSIIDTIRSLMPDAIKEAEMIKDNKKQIIDEAIAQAKSIVGEATAEKNKLVDQQIISSETERKAMGIYNSYAAAGKRISEEGLEIMSRAFKDSAETLQLALEALNKNRGILENQLLDFINKDY